MKLNQIKPNKANPRVIKDDKFKKLVRSLQSFPQMMQKRPIVVDSDMTILGGNMRYKALVEIYGKSGEIPDEWVTTADGWTDEQKREFIIKDNASYGEWDVEMLQEAWDVDEMNEWGVDVPEWNDPSEGVSPDDFGDNFELPKGEKAPFQQMAFSLADGSAVAGLTLDLQQRSTKEKYDKMCGLDPTKRYTRNDYIKAGAQVIPGFMLRYIYFLDPKWRKRLTVPEIPFSKIDEMGAGMYKGENVSRVSRHVECEAQEERRQNAEKH